MKVSDVVAIAAFAISLTALLWNVAVMWLKWPRIVVEVAVRRRLSPMTGVQKQGGISSSEDEAFVLTIINNGSEPVTIKSMGFKGSGTNKKFRLDFLTTWRGPGLNFPSVEEQTTNRCCQFVSKVTTATFTNTPSRRYRSYHPTSTITATPSAIRRFADGLIARRSARPNPERPCFGTGSAPLWPRDSRQRNFTPPRRRDETAMMDEREGPGLTEFLDGSRATLSRAAYSSTSQPPSRYSRSNAVPKWFTPSSARRHYLCERITAAQRTFLESG
jgi:hypothetical protein